MSEYLAWLFNRGGVLPKPNIKHKPEVYDPKFKWHLTNAIGMRLLPTGRWSLKESPDNISMYIEASKYYKKDVNEWYHENELLIGYEAIEIINECNKGNE